MRGRHLLGRARRGLLPVLALWLALPLASGACHARRPSSNTVHEAKSKFNGTVTVTDERGVRVLRFGRGGARQTAIIKGKPQHLELQYARALIAALGVVDKPKSVLIVGLGGGAIPAFLRHHYPKMRIDAVDIDPVVVDLAKRFFDFREDARMKAHVGDGRAFIEKATRKWDVIMLDAYGSSSIPLALATRQFLEAVRARLTPGGVVAANIWQPRHNTLYYPMRKTYRAVFKEIHFVQVTRGSDIFLAMNHTPKLGARSLRARCAAVQKAKGFSYDLADMVRRGYFADSGDLRGEVLVDPAK